MASSTGGVVSSGGGVASGVGGVASGSCIREDGTSTALAVGCLSGALDDCVGVCVCVGTST